MIRALVDTDVVISAMLGNEDQSAECQALMNALEAGEFVGITTPVIMANIQYVLGRRWELKRDQPDRARVAKAMLELLPLFSEMIPVAIGDFYASIASKFMDLEDGLQHFAAMRAGGIDAIVTCNGKDFGHSNIDHYTPTDFIIEYLGEE
ncbi:MAG TPA: PIN domain-containing protein [Flavobacteriales bacterium]|nr:PIN domain-containing protein [Flavobacteriales bacterium]HNM69112.1 PIN domain-containing protein [Flavobacteriales bacterium]HNO05542.1 PIN domain-containing protein [Flavobacteriales bacterium]